MVRSRTSSAVWILGLVVLSGCPFTAATKARIDEKTGNAGLSDSGVVIADVGGTRDAAVGEDAAAVDMGFAVDSGFVADTGVVVDAGVVPDAAVARDAGSAPDADVDAGAPAGMVFIPGGPFWMNCDVDAGGCGADGFRRADVGPYYIDRTEVTVQAYSDCMDAGVCQPPLVGGARCFAGRDAGPTEPVTCFQPDQAVRFCEDFRGGRLPTEAEWEKAARGDLDKRDYPWGDSPVASCAYVHMNDSSAGGEGCGTVAVAPVGSYSLPGAGAVYDLVDMVGNVYELVAGTSSVGGVRRGGSFIQGAPRVTIRERQDYVYGGPYDNYGFRCVWP